MADKRKTDEPVRAVALRHDRAAPAAPQVLAKGDGELARRIADLAEAEGIPVRRDSDLVELLSAVDVGREIPAELYEAVAALLAFLYQLNGSVVGPPPAP